MSNNSRDVIENETIRPVWPWISGLRDDRIDAAAHGARMNHLRRDCKTPFDWTRCVLTLSAVLLLTFYAALLPAEAQSPDCERIKNQIAMIDQGGGARPNSYGLAAQKQQTEIDRTSAYARSLGCGSYSFFGSQPAQCGALDARIRGMQANLSQLQSMAGRSGNPAERQDLVARYNAYCRSQPRGFFESLFGGPSTSNQPEEPLEAPPPPDDGENTAAHGGSQAICVRQCDGGFFPLNYSARRGNSDSLEDLCKALCPNAEVSLYSRNPDNDVGSAVGADGTSYRDLANAFKFTKTYDPSCSCRAKGVSWVQALAQSDAEHVLGQERKGDIIVTPEKSLEMSRPKIDVPMRSKLPIADPSQAQIDRSPLSPKSGAVAAAAAPKPGSPSSSTPLADDLAGTQEITGPDGVKRRVRIVGPTP